MIYNLELAYLASTCILLLSTLISALELICVPKLFIDFVYTRTDLQNKYRSWIYIHIAQVFAVIFTAFFLLTENAFYFKFSFLILTAITLYSYLQRKIGKDGSDQVRLLSLLSYSICFILDRDNGQLLSLLFSGIQVLIGYTTSGVVKLFSKYWRKGDVLSGILSTYSYGIPEVARYLRKYPGFEKAITYGAIFAMLAVPISFLFPWQEILLTSLAMILTFHLSTSILMGLNDFLITFPLAYPGIVLLHSLIFNY